MEQKKIEQITLHLIIFGTIIIIGEPVRPYFTMVGTSLAAILFL